MKFVKFNFLFNRLQEKKNVSLIAVKRVTDSIRTSYSLFNWFGILDFAEMADRNEETYEPNPSYLLVKL